MQTPSPLQTYSWPSYLLMIICIMLLLTTLYLHDANAAAPRLAKPLAGTTANRELIGKIHEAVRISLTSSETFTVPFSIPDPHWYVVEVDGLTIWGDIPDKTVCVRQCNKDVITVEIKCGWVEAMQVNAPADTDAD